MLNNLSVEALSNSGWRVCDHRRPAHDARRILGFVEKKGDQFEVMAVDHGFEWLTFDSLADAVAHFEREPVGAPGAGQHALAWMNTQT